MNWMQLEFSVKKEEPKIGVCMIMISLTILLVCEDYGTNWIFYILDQDYERNFIILNKGK